MSRAASVNAGRLDHSMKQSRPPRPALEIRATFEEVTGWQVPLHYGDMRRGVSRPSERRSASPTCPIGANCRVTGDDRIKWLQSVISNDLLPLQPGQGRYSSFLTHKGKMLGYFRVYMQPEAVWLGRRGRDRGRNLSRR